MTNHEEHHYPCVWPECPRSYDPCTGPAEDGWIRLFSGHLCPDHRDTGHTPQRFEWEQGAPTLAMSCECGARVEDLSPTTRARCVQWWREHIRSANQREEPEIVTICGSMGLFDDMVRVAAELSTQGVLVQLPFPVPDAAVHKATLDLLHRQRIDRSHRVIVVTRNGRIGESTRGEIDYAQAVGKPVEYRNCEEEQ